MRLEVVDELVEIVGSCPNFASFVRELDLGRLNMQRYFTTMTSLDTVSPEKGKFFQGDFSVIDRWCGLC